MMNEGSMTESDNEKNDEKLIQGIRYHALNKKLEELRALEKTLPAIEKEATMIPWRTLLAVAAVLVVGVFAFLMMQFGADPKDLYAKNFEPYPNVFEPTQRGAAETAGKRATAFAMYEQKNYSEAARLFNELLSEKKEPEILLLLGNANIALNHDEEAKNNFITLIGDFDGLDEQGKWFLSLVYLKSGDIEQARVIWKELGDSNNSYSEKANSLLKQTK